MRIEGVEAMSDQGKLTALVIPVRRQVGHLRDPEATWQSTFDRS